VPTSTSELTSATRLWCAAFSERMEAVKSLVEHNGQVNVLSHTTAIIKDCRNEMLDIVRRYLLENGSDISVADKREGATCLIHSVHTKEICHNVIEHRALVNAVNDRRYTAVHCVIEAPTYRTSVERITRANVHQCSFVLCQIRHFLRANSQPHNTRALNRRYNNTLQHINTGPSTTPNSSTQPTTKRVSTVRTTVSAISGESATSKPTTARATTTTATTQPQTKTVTQTKWPKNAIWHRKSLRVLQARTLNSGSTTLRTTVVSKRMTITKN